MSLSKKEANLVLAAMREVLGQNFPEYTVKFKPTKFSTEGEIDFKFSLIKNGAVDAIADRDTKIGMIKNNIHPDAIGQKFESGGKYYIIESVKSRKQKYSVLARRISDNKVFKFNRVLINEKVAEKTDLRFNYYLGNKAVMIDLDGE